MEERIEEEIPEEESRLLECAGTGERLDVCLSAGLSMTRSRAAKWIEEGRCSVEGSVVTRPAFRTAEGSRICLEVPPPRPARPVAEDLPLHILYEDRYLAVVEKPCGMVVHPAPGHERGTLVNALLYHLEALGGIGGETRPGIVHRLDKDTSGLLLVAKDDETQAFLSRELAERRVEKHYRALTEGIIREGGTVSLPIARSRTDRKKMAVDPEGREAVTLYTVLGAGRNCTYLDVRILTGRTHQIRVHMKALGHPLCGDCIYGPEKVKVSRLMLHALSLTFTHPRGERMTFVCPEPPEFVENLRRCGVENGQTPVPIHTFSTEPDKP